MFRTMMTSLTSRKKTIFQFAAETADNLTFLSNLIDTGKIKPWIDKTYPLEKTAEAHAYVGGGNKKGCVVIKVQ